MFIHWNIINCCLVLQVSSQGVRWGELSQKREGQRNSHVCLCALALALIAGRNRSLEARGVESSSHTATNDSANKRNDLLRAVFECGVIAAKAEAKAETAHRVTLGGEAKSTLGYATSRGYSIKMAELEERAKQPKGSRAGLWPIPAATTVGAAYGRAQARARARVRAGAAPFA